jgi:hypothetical protein
MRPPAPVNAASTTARRLSRRVVRGSRTKGGSVPKTLEHRAGDEIAKTRNVYGPLTDSDNGQDLYPVFCWCERKLVLVPQRMVAKALTFPCKRPECAVMGTLYVERRANAKCG